MKTIKKIMPTFIGFLLGVGITIGVSTLISINAPYVYPATLIITDLSETNFKAKTATGIEYEIPDPPEDMAVGDLISCIIDDAGTKFDITDDTVLDWQYAGFFD